MTEEQRKRGRPKGEENVRNTRISGYVTEEDAEYIREIGENLGFTSTSEMVTAIFERLCIGGFSAMVFTKLGWQFSNLTPKKRMKRGLYLGIRPLPPLIGDGQQEPSEKDFTRHLDEVKREVKEKGV